jgi:hypothetical protein
MAPAPVGRLRPARLNGIPRPRAPCRGTASTRRRCSRG